MNPNEPANREENRKSTGSSSLWPAPNRTPDLDASTKPMASNRFNQRPVPRQRPAICHPPPDPPYPIVPITKPRNLAGFVRWTDLDPAVEYPPDVSDYVDLAEFDPTPWYKGVTPPNRFHVMASVRMETAPDVYLVQLLLYEFGLHTETHNWQNVKIHFPFDTGLLTHTVIPGQDFRIARFME